MQFESLFDEDKGRAGKATHRDELIVFPRAAYVNTVVAAAVLVATPHARLCAFFHIGGLCCTSSVRRKNIQNILVVY